MLAYITRKAYFTVIPNVFVHPFPLNMGCINQLLLSSRENVLTQHLLKDVVKFGWETGFLSFFLKVKSNFLVDSTCDSIDPDYCFPL